MAKNQIVFRQDPARVHTSVVDMRKFNELGYEVVIHSPNFPDSLPSDFLVSNFEEMVRLTRGPGQIILFGRGQIILAKVYGAQRKLNFYVEKSVFLSKSPGLIDPSSYLTQRSTFHLRIMKLLNNNSWTRS